MIHEYTDCMATMLGRGPNSAEKMSCDGRSSRVETRPNTVS